MKRIIDGKKSDTETAEPLLHHAWKTHHPNISGGEPTCNHVRAIYRTKSGKLFTYSYDASGYGRDRNGITGIYYRRTEDITPLGGAADAIAWCELEDCFDVEDIEKHFEVDEA